MFKFYTIPSEDIIDKLIGEEATIKLSSAFNLNDPYELKFNLDIDPLAEGHEKEYYKNNHICFSVHSVQAFTDVLKKRSIEFEDINGKKGSISSRVDGVKQIWLRDPDGYWLEINDAKD